MTNTEVDVTGLTRRSYHRHLRGVGYAVDARFRPVAEVLGRDTTELARRVAERDDPSSRAALLAGLLAEDWPRTGRT